MGGLIVYHQTIVYLVTISQKEASVEYDNQSSRDVLLYKSQ